MIRAPMQNSWCWGGASGVWGGNGVIYGLFPPTETETETEMEMDSFPDGYIVLCRTFSTDLDPDTDPCMETFPDGYCTHFRDGSPSQ